ncbi:MAG: hypothetical protein Q7T18_12310 [Sedimentisphaerales bacterium]|nr:hypothetical protein [Sedimentisphaerales bacterium]
MFKHTVLALIVPMLSVCFLSDTLGAETFELFSPSISDTFREKAVCLYADPNATMADARQAVVFLAAADAVDRQMGRTLPNMVQLAWRFPNINIYDRIKPVFLKYAANDDADLEVLRLGMQYLLEPLNSREARGQFLATALRTIGTRHKLLASDIETQLGLLSMEGVDMEAAEQYLMQGYNSNMYNKVAFQKLMEIDPEMMSPPLYVRYLRFMMGANPYDIDAAYAFANGAYNVGLYGIAASAYEYCADLFAAQHPNEPLPSAIYLPWAMSNYNEPKNLKQCLAIEQSENKRGNFNLYLEAIAGNAALKLGNAEEGDRILLSAAQKAASLLTKDQMQAHDLAWFYCFAKPNPEKALEWANKANASEPNSPRTAAILAYALVMNDQQEVARPLVEQDYKGNQIAALAMGQILVADPNADPNATLGIIKSAISLDAGSLEAQRGKELLAKKDSTYVPMYETAGISKALRSEFGDTIVGTFVTADKLITAKISAIGNEFPYGSHFNASLAITNNGNYPLIISDGGLFNGNIRVDAVVKGDLNERLPNLVSEKIRPSQPIEHGRSLFIPLKLIRGKLATLLLEHPQASVEIEFTAWLDPVTDTNGAVHNAVSAIAPMRLTIKRNAIDVSGTYLQTRLSSLVQGQPGQKIKTAQLFSGLLLEQRATAGKKTYRMTYIEPQLLRSGLARCLADENWTLRAETLLLLGDLTLDYNLTTAASESLNSNFWPVRMTALWLLGKNVDPAFKKVRDWTAQNDSDQMVIDMAIAIGAPALQQVVETSPVEPQPEAVVKPKKADQPAKAVVAETNQPATTVSTEPNLPETVAVAEPNQPHKKKNNEPNDVIEDILKL